MVGFSTMHESLFRHFGVAGTLVSDLGTTDVTVILEFGVEELDEFNEVVGRVDKVSVRNQEATTLKGQKLRVLAGEFSGYYTLGRKLKSNGYIEVREIVRLAD